MTRVAALLSLALLASTSGASVVAHLYRAPWDNPLSDDIKETDYDGDGI